ncbi:MAG: hypothetical protein QXT63_07105 [Thermoplasmata archaeon]
MPNLLEHIVGTGGHLEIQLPEQLKLCHNNDMVRLKGPLHAIAKRYADGKEKGWEEIILMGPTNNIESVKREQGGQNQDIVITLLPGNPFSPNGLEHIVEKHHVDKINHDRYIMHHQNDKIKIRGPAKFTVKWTKKNGQINRAEEIQLNSTYDIREYVLKSDQEDLIIEPHPITQPQAVATPPTAVAPPQPATMEVSRKLISAPRRLHVVEEYATINDTGTEFEIYTPTQASRLVVTASLDTHKATGINAKGTIRVDFDGVNVGQMTVTGGVGPTYQEYPDFYRGPGCSQIFQVNAMPGTHRVRFTLMPGSAAWVEMRADGSDITLE